MIPMEIKDGTLLPFFEPVIARNPTVMLIDFAVTLPPLVECPFRDFHPAENLLGGLLGTLLPVVDVIHDGIASLVGNPNSV